MARERKSAGDRRAEIVGTAIRLAGENGPDRVTTQALADAIGISQPAIFRHFPTKKDIWLAVGEAMTAPMTAEIEADPDADPLTTLERSVAQQMRRIAQTPAIPAILFSRELHAENEPLRQHFEAVTKNRRAQFEKLLLKARDGNLLDQDAPTADLAALILAAIQGLAMRWSLENRGFDLAEEGQRLVSVLISRFRRAA